MIDSAAIIDRITKQGDPESVPEDATENVAEETDSGGDHYGQLFDALKSGDRASGVAALKACLSGLASASPAGPTDI